MPSWSHPFQLAALLALSSACSPTYFHGSHIVRQARPNPLVHVKRFDFAPVTFEGFRVVVWRGFISESKWLAIRTPAERARWSEFKAAVTSLMLARFQIEKRPDEEIRIVEDPPAPGRFTLAINIHELDSSFHWTLRVCDPQGVLVDELEGRPVDLNWFEVANPRQLRAVTVIVPHDSLRYLRARYSR